LAESVTLKHGLGFSFYLRQWWSIAALRWGCCLVS